jgi:hypothetical protein
MLKLLQGVRAITVREAKQVVLDEIDRREIHAAIIKEGLTKSGTDSGMRPLLS